MEYSERLEQVNARLRTKDIKGKPYVEVPQRIAGFWALFPNGAIITRKVADDGSRCDFECMVYRDAGDEQPAAIGHAYEIKQGVVNSTSYVENCETSAVGRALGLLGIGSGTSLASAEEVRGAMAQRGDHLQPIRDLIRPYAKRRGLTVEAAKAEVEAWAGVEDMAEIAVDFVPDVEAMMREVIG